MQERPLECKNCQKPLAVVYKDLSQKASHCTMMCADCPLLKQKLHGDESTIQTNKETPLADDLCCSHCNLKLKDFLAKGMLGCDQCYEIFQDAIITKLEQDQLLPPSASSYTLNSSSTLHIGHTPKEPMMIKESEAIKDLYDALKLAVDGENYEHAAKIRDQIKQLTERIHDSPS